MIKLSKSQIKQFKDQGYIIFKSFYPKKKLDDTLKWLKSRDPKKIALFLFSKIFFSEKGNIRIPIMIIIGIFTAIQIGIYVEGKSWAYIILPNVVVPTLLKWLAFIFIVVINNDGSIRKIGFSKNENITIPKIKKIICKL